MVQYFESAAQPGLLRAAPLACGATDGVFDGTVGGSGKHALHRLHTQGLPAEEQD